jgi:hypothetical protein
MSYQLSVIVAGAETVLTDSDLCWVESYDGVGMAPTKRITDNGPMQHGDTDLGFRLNARIIHLVLGLSGASRQDEQAKRAALLSLFRPRSYPIALRWTYDDGSMRQIDCHYNGDMSMPIQAGNGFAEKIGLTMRAADPTFYDPNAVLVSFGLGGGGHAFTVPSPVPTHIGASSLNQILQVKYPGSWLTYPYVIRITGPITDPVIANDTTGEMLSFSGTALGNGQYLEIDCRYGRKTVVDQTGANKISLLSPSSNLATFHLGADDEAPGGYNAIRARGININVASRIDIGYYVRYVGI